MESLHAFMEMYVPGFIWLTIFLFVHVLTASIAYAKTGGFSFSKWPGFIKQFIMFIAMIILAGGAVEVSRTIEAGLLLPFISGIRAILYAGYFSYYLDNICKHLNLLGWPINPDLLGAIGQLTEKVKSTIFH